MKDINLLSTMFLEIFSLCLFLKIVFVDINYLIHKMFSSFAISSIAFMLRKRFCSVLNLIKPHHLRKILHVDMEK